MCPRLSHPDGALATADPSHVSLRAYAHAGHNRQAGGLAHFDGPLHLLYVLEILRQVKTDVVV